MPTTEMTPQQRHRDYLDDSGVAYGGERRGRTWHLTCAWCPHEVTGKTKREAVGEMEDHYGSLGVAVELF